MAAVAFPQRHGLFVDGQFALQQVVALHIGIVVLIDDLLLLCDYPVHLRDAKGMVEVNSILFLDVAHQPYFVLTAESSLSQQTFNFYLVCCLVQQHHRHMSSSPLVLSHSLLLAGRNYLRNGSMLQLSIHLILLLSNPSLS